jgi:hypothetical protein
MSNLDSLRPDKTQIEIGGKIRTIKFDMNAFAELEKKYGSVEEAMNRLQSGKISDLRVVLWAGLIHEEVVLDEETGEPLRYNIAPYTVGSWIESPAELEQMGKKLVTALDNNTPGQDNPEEVKN